MIYIDDNNYMQDRDRQLGRLHQQSRNTVFGEHPLLPQCHPVQELLGRFQPRQQRRRKHVQWWEIIIMIDKW